MTTLWVDDPGFESPQGYGGFFKMSRTSLGLIQPPTQRYLGSFLRVKGPGSEGDHTPLPSAEVKNEWSCTPAPPIFRHGMDKHNCNFYGLGGQGIRFPAVASHFFSMGTGNLSPNVKWPRRVDDHSHPPTAMVTIAWVQLYLHFPIRLHYIHRLNLCSSTVKTLKMEVLRSSKSRWPLDTA
jgi:hypothetical protein